MDELISFLIGVLANLTTDAAKAAYAALISSNTDEAKRRAALKAIGVIKIAAQTGSLTLSGSEQEWIRLESEKLIHTDHQDGEVSVHRAALKSTVIETGGRGCGCTRLEESSLEAAASKITMGPGTVITITGSAGIKLT